MRGAALRALRQFEAAVEALRQAVEIEARHAQARLALEQHAGLDLDRLACGEHHLRRAILLDPRLPEAAYEPGVSARREQAAGRGRWPPAMWRYELQADFARRILGTAVSLELLGGDFARGWEDYEWRKRHDPVRAGFPVAARAGMAGRAAGRIFATRARGTGATRHYHTSSRGTSAAAGGARGAEMVLACAPPLVPLLRDLALAVPRSEALPAYDFWVDQMSLPRLFGTRVDSIPTPEGYLRRGCGAPGGLRRVGIVWAGNPAHSNDARRSMPVSALAPLMAVPGIEWVSLQVGPGSGATSGAVRGGGRVGGAGRFRQCGGPDRDARPGDRRGYVDGAPGGGDGVAGLGDAAVRAGLAVDDRAGGFAVACASMRLFQKQGTPGDWAGVGSGRWRWRWRRGPRES